MAIANSSQSINGLSSITETMINSPFFMYRVHEKGGAVDRSPFQVNISYLCH
uniref:Uncharacterized protein n=1 Tax=Magnetococcus massalia (strain MO-1) TaxID=451514 RepID=A0A1S7LCS0_MAGMO|nr:protein of unknown function [Candidatus Magnetococcus massalia]